MHPKNVHLIGLNTCWTFVNSQVDLSTISQSFPGKFDRKYMKVRACLKFKRGKSAYHPFLEPFLFKMHHVHHWVIRVYFPYRWR